MQQKLMEVKQDDIYIKILTNSVEIARIQDETNKLILNYISNKENSLDDRWRVWSNYFNEPLYTGKIDVHKRNIPHIECLQRFNNFNNVWDNEDNGIFSYQVDGTELEYNLVYQLMVEEFGFRFRDEVKVELFVDILEVFNKEERAFETREWVKEIVESEDGVSSERNVIKSDFHFILKSDINKVKEFLIENKIKSFTFD